VGIEFFERAEQVNLYSHGAERLYVEQVYLHSLQLLALKAEIVRSVMQRTKVNARQVARVQFPGQTFGIDPGSANEFERQGVADALVDGMQLANAADSGDKESRFSVRHVRRGRR